MREAVKDPVLFLGRTPIWVNFPKIPMEDPQGNGSPPLLTKRRSYSSHKIKTWEQTPIAEANAWISRSRFDHNLHLPCFDVDHNKHLFFTKIQSVFPEAECEWVPSTTMGNFHVYVEHAYEFEDYITRLHYLSTNGIPIEKPFVRSIYLEISEETSVNGRLLNLGYEETSVNGRLLNLGYVETPRVYRDLITPVQNGYVEAAKANGGSIVRMPHIKKQFMNV